MADSQDKDRGVVSKQRLYQMTAVHALKAIELLVEAMEKGENYATKVGAAKTILAKCIPDLKATELTGEGGNEILIKILDYANSNKHYTPAETTVSTTDERE